MNRRRALTGIAGIFSAIAMTVGLSTTAPAAAAEGPEFNEFPSALLYSFAHWNADPPGANDWNCQPSGEHSRPVVLVHGTWENRFNNFAKLSPELKKAGHCVFALNYGRHGLDLLGLHPAVNGTGDIRRSAKELRVFVDKVLAATGASQVDIVGHSQGGLMPRQYLKSEGGAGKVRNLVTLGATHHGTTLLGLGTLANVLGLAEYSNLLLGDAAKQQIEGSEFLRTLNAGGDTVPGVNYLVIATRYDEVTTPYQSTFLTAGPGATVTNVTVQDGCEVDISEHVELPYSPRVIGMVKRGLDPSAPAPPCVPNLPIG
ncbi:triacylglycerol esterase/lipase EstA (alpha/beta hydrolase family) [Herbihabitans rhizosphaerae]|uniref:Triacylglycerol esterase/lipase EstA (Alpha/beta hydrolase family) n=1 Tax=Herbihabitans rhizosphaerae TaxID=1872711 RepID=A0A4Q7KWX5_9PSEU|nr:alpha/beta fold hydrolase [Herbihabitans rhizosphaerae]RZS41205.1 triacylglycerol esterase/lipase EstA (alpha/beta hydrolase family) [Herbihabitans rhizosphaerae]